MPLTRPAPRPRGEPTIALINIIFLMLIFFMIAGTLTPSLDSRIALVETAKLEGRAPPDVAVILSDGSLTYRENPITVGEIVTLARESSTEADSPAIRIVPDRTLSADTLLRIASELRAAGGGDIWLVTEKGVK